MLGDLLQLVLWVLLICGCMVIMWAIVDLLRADPEPPYCACGARIVRNGPLPDFSDTTLHARELCQPFREWVDD